MLQQVGVAQWDVALRITQPDQDDVPFTLRLAEDVWQMVPGGSDEAKSDAVSTALSEWLANNTVNANDVLGLRIERGVPGGQLLRPLAVERRGN